MIARAKRQKPDSRPYTELTVYLVQKWYREGLMVPEIAGLLGRTSYQIRAILNIDLPPEDYTKMGEYSSGTKRREG